MSFPKIIYRHREFGKTGVVLIKDSQYLPAEKVQDLSAIAAKTLEERGARIFLKNAARIAAKGQINKEASRQFGELGGLLVNVFNMATETADTRSWTALPSEYRITRIAMAPGTYDIKILTDGSVEQIRSVKIDADAITLIRGYLSKSLSDQDSKAKANKT